MRGQVTIFIIIGLLVLIAFGVTMYATSRVRTAQVAPTQEGLSVQSIQDYVLTCLSLASEEAFVVMGAQGGLIAGEPDSGTATAGARRVSRCSTRPTG